MRASKTRLSTSSLCFTVYLPIGNILLQERAIPAGMSQPSSNIHHSPARQCPPHLSDRQQTDAVTTIMSVFECVYCVGLACERWYEDVRGCVRLREVVGRCTGAVCCTPEAKGGWLRVGTPEVDQKQTHGGNDMHVGIQILEGYPRGQRRG